MSFKLKYSEAKISQYMIMKEFDRNETQQPSDSTPCPVNFDSKLHFSHLLSTASVQPNA